MGDTTPGPGVDAAGRPVLDPTANVLDLVNAAIKRQDDLRESEAAHVREIVALRADYDRELRRAESDRINAIRAVDVGAVNRAAEVAATQATVLAAQLQATAEAGRVNLNQALDPIMKDIQEIRKVQYEQQGAKSQTVETTTRQQFTVGNLVAIAGLAVVSLALMVNIVVSLTK